MDERSGTVSNAVVPSVSVIVPAYNVAGYLERALNSALSQTMSDLEVIVVDDASDDGTFAEACRVAGRDSRVRVLLNDHNSGAAMSRNRAISAARGEWIALLDGDDTWLPERLERMMTYTDDADVISDDVRILASSLIKREKHTSWSFLRERGLILTKTHWLSLLDFTRYDLGLVQPLIRRSFLKHHRLTFDPAVRVSHDFLFYFEILASGARWLQLPQGYYLVTSGRAGSNTSNARLLWQSIIESTQALFSHQAVAGDAALAAALELRIQRARNALIFNTVRDALQRHNFSELAHVLLKQPSNLLSVARFMLSILHRRVVLSRAPRKL